MNKDVKISCCIVDRFEYHKDVPFRPSEHYPEYPFGVFSKTKNPVYETVREAFHLMGYDSQNYGTGKWNPLGEVIKKNDFVLIKPNLVLQHNGTGEGEECLYTQPSVVAAVIDYCLIALGGTGRIVIGDAPIQSCDFDRLVAESGYIGLIDFYRNHGIEIELLDFRSVISNTKATKKLKNDDRDGIEVDLGCLSKFYDVESKNTKYRITSYNPKYVMQNHHGSIQKYLIHKYVLNADVIINMPKPKCHRKAGITASLKNFVGINCRKEYLPHHVFGAISEGGDEYCKKNYFKKQSSKYLDYANKYYDEKRSLLGFFCRSLSDMYNIFSKLRDDGFSEGSWYGNHTISKTIADLNTIVKYSDKTGSMQSNPQRRIIVVADMIICGEKEGPLLPSPKAVGAIVVSNDLLSFDEFVCLVMGFNPLLIPTFVDSTEEKKDWEVVSNSPKFNKKNRVDLANEPIFRFEPSSGWKGHIEL